jgi:CubicO group peptidase (beta-lactamase class C family)
MTQPETRRTGRATGRFARTPSTLVSPLLAAVAAALLAACSPHAGEETGDASAASGPEPTELRQLLPDAPARMHQYLSAVEALGFSGAIIVEHNGQEVLREGYGLADRATRRPFTPETVQTMGSITKPLTAAAVLLLVERGELGLEDPISRFWEGVPPDKVEITLHHLLTHQAGFPGGIGGDAESIDRDAFLGRALATPLEFEPGTGYGYSNVGYSLLRILLEELGGRGYEDILREDFFEPLGMRATGYLGPSWPDSALAQGYRGGEEFGRVMGRGWLSDGPGWNLRANGGLHTTVDDMRRWLAVLQGRGPLSAESATLWTTGFVDEGGGDSFYGYGWEVWDETPTGRLIAHNGGNPAFGADFVWLPEREFFFYVHGNTSLVSAPSLRRGLLAAAFEADASLPSGWTADPGADPARAAERGGVYAGEGGTVTLTPDDTRLLATLRGQRWLDAFVGAGSAELPPFAELNTRTSDLMESVREGREDALVGRVPEDADPRERARALLEFLGRGGPIQSTEVVGTVANLPGTRFAAQGGAATFVQVGFLQRQAILSVLWNLDGTYRGAAMGPLSDVPEFMLIPQSNGRYLAVERREPWRSRPVRFQEGCLEVEGLRACRR